MVERSSKRSKWDQAGSESDNSVKVDQGPSEIIPPLPDEPLAPLPPQSPPPMPQEAPPPPPPEDEELDEGTTPKNGDASSLGVVSSRPNVVRPNLDPTVCQKRVDGLVKHIDINDMRNRYFLVRKHIKEKIESMTGAKITKGGKFYPNRKHATLTDPAMHIVVKAQNKEVMKNACHLIEEYLHKPLVTGDVLGEDSLRLSMRPQKNQIYEERIPIGLEDSGMPVGQVRGKIVGPAGANVKFIHQSTGVKAQLRGRGSAYKEPDTGRELNEPLFAYMKSTSSQSIAQAKRIFEDLLERVKEEVHYQMSLYRQYTMYSFAGYAPGAMQQQYPPPMGMNQMPVQPMSGGIPATDMMPDNLDAEQNE